MTYDLCYDGHTNDKSMGRRVIDIFDDDGNGEVDFKEFIMGLSHFR